MRRRLVASLAVVVLALTGLAAVTWGQAPSGEYKIGVLEPLTGPLAGWGSVNPSDARAAMASTRPCSTEKLTGTALDSSACSTCVFVRPVFAENRRPAIPATTGAAEDVPPTGAYPGPPLIAGHDVMLPSGAASLTHVP